MPKRTTTTYSSEDAVDTDRRIFVYYCRYSGEPAFITDADLEALPMRKTDNARVIDTQEHHVKLKVHPGAVKYLKRGDNQVEKQYRYNCGDLPVLYKSEEKGRYIYVMDGAVTAFTGADNGAYIGKEAGGDEIMVPPCIQNAAGGKVQIAVDIEDKCSSAAIVRITADEVGLEVTSSMQKPQDFLDEVREYLGKCLRVRLGDIKIERGWSARSRLLLVEGISPEQVCERLSKAMEQSKKAYIQAAVRDSRREAAKESLQNMPVVGLHTS